MSDKLFAVLASVDALNSEDPNYETYDGSRWPRERLYSERMSSRLAEFCPQASDELQIAVRAQHVERWKSSRTDFPAGKAGYYRWRTDLGKMHATIASDLMRKEGYTEESIARVQKLLTKQGIKQDGEVQVLEDVACLVFLEHYFLAFAAKHEQAKVIDIVQKTWKKMSLEGQSAARALPLSSGALALVAKALADG